MALLAALGLQAFGLKRRSRFIVLTTRLFSRSLVGLNRPIGTILLAITAAFFMILARNENTLVLKGQAVLMDVTAPIVDIVNRPLQSISSWLQFVRTQASLQAQIRQLQDQNTHLMKWQHVALRYKNENQQLRGLLNVIHDPRMSFITAHLIVKSSDSFHKNFVIEGSHRQGINKDQAVLTATGIIGRIINVGMTTSRILVVTDISSRIPVCIESNGEHAILAGNNSPELKLIHLKKPVKVVPGDRLMTSGYGGVFPPGLPVAVVTSVSGNTISARAVVDLDQLDFVMVLDNRNQGSSETLLVRTPTTHHNG